MILDTITKSIQAALAAGVVTTPLAFTADFVAASGGTSTGGSSTSGTISGVTPVTLVPAPTQPNLKFTISDFTVFNGDTAPAALTISLNNNSVLTTWYKATLQPGDNLFYQGVSGSFYVVASDGSVRGVTPLPFGAASEATLQAISSMLALSTQNQTRLLQGILRQLIALGEARGMATPVDQTLVM